MAKILIPRSDSISAKIIEPSDFEKFNTDDIIPDYKYSGFTLSAGSGLAVNVSSGVCRLKGLYLENSATESVGSLTANDVNYIYVKLARDSNSEAESWDFDKNLTGTAPTDGFFIGTATTDGSSVTAVDQSTVKDKAFPKLQFIYFGDGPDGDVTLSTNTNINQVKHYNNLTINSGITLTSTQSTEACLIIKVKNTLTINGTVNMDGKGGVGGAGRTGGAGGAGGTFTGGSSNSPSPPRPGKPGQVGDVGGLGQIGNSDTHKLEYESGEGSGNGGTGGRMIAGWADEIITSSNFGSGYFTTEEEAFKSVLGTHNTALIPHVQPGLANVENTRLNDPFYISTNMPQFFGGGGSGGTSGGGGAGGTGSVSGGSGVSGPAGGAGGNSGAGGAGGGGIILMAKNIVIGSSGVLTADGVNGSNGASGGNGTDASHPSVGNSQGGGSGGGGGGGEAGQIILLYETYSNAGSGNITMTGGTGGSAGSTATYGSAGGAGGNGASKTLKQVDVS